MEDIFGSYNKQRPFCVWLSESCYLISDVVICAHLHGPGAAPAGFDASKAAGHKVFRPAGLAGGRYPCN